MAYSMTGFGRSERTFESRHISIELKSVNNRFCDINIRLPRICNFAEAIIRKQISDKLLRGKVDVFISYEDLSEGTSEIVINESLVKAYSETSRKISSLTGREDDLMTSRLMTFADTLSIRQASIDEAKLGEELSLVLDAALDDMLQMRHKEGNALASDIIKKVGKLEDLRSAIKERAPLVVEDYKLRLSTRVNEILEPEKREFFDEGRLMAEVSLFADRCAIDEELKRLSSHFSQAGEILSKDSATEGTGKKMDFLMQEINREINTIGSKANDIEITNNVLAMKNIAEQVREQIQNLV